MTVVGIICEYNPFHNGHKKQLCQIRQAFGPSTGIVCLMSGNFVQRGAPAVFDKLTRAKAAVLCGADLVLELPVTCALSSAEGFAAGGVELLTRLGMVDILSFGSETGDEALLMSVAQALLQPELDLRLKEALNTGISYAAARQLAMERLSGGACLTKPNDILAVEYCKAILRQKSGLRPHVICRQGDYAAGLPEAENPSALSLRAAMEQGGPWLDCVPPEVRALYQAADRYTLAAGERAVLARLRTLSQEEFGALPYGSEGLWRKLMHACRSRASVEEILQAAKSKRYARTRLQRMLMCAYLGISGQLLAQPVPYVRALAFNNTGRRLLKRAKQGTVPVVNGGQAPENREYYELECRCSDLFGLFLCREKAAPCGKEQKLRNFYLER